MQPAGTGPSYSSTRGTKQRLLRLLAVTVCAHGYLEPNTIMRLQYRVTTAAPFPWKSSHTE